jgi:hypothetical protein
MSYISEQLIQIEKSISSLSKEEQLWLVERIIHNLRKNDFNQLANLPKENIEQQLAKMANDPAIQAELIAINQEFADTEMDGLIAESLLLRFVKQI